MAGDHPSCSSVSWRRNNWRRQQREKQAAEQRVAEAVARIVVEQIRQAGRGQP